MSKKKKNKVINTYVGEHEIKLPDKLINDIFDEIMKQIDDDFKDISFEIIIEVINESPRIDDIPESLSDFNKKLKQALNFNPKDKK